MKRVVLWVCALMMTLIASVCVAGTYSPYFETEPPREVREHVASRWPDYEFEDYCEVRGTPKGDYGFALVHRKNERILVGYHKVDGEMKYWLKNAGAVPQGKEEAWFDVGTAGWEEETDWVGNFTGRQVYDDGLCFSVTQLDGSAKVMKKVFYRWENGMFRRTATTSRKAAAYAFRMTSWILSTGRIAFTAARCRAPFSAISAMCPLTRCRCGSTMRKRS